MVGEFADGRALGDGDDEVRIRCSRQGPLNPDRPCDGGRDRTGSLSASKPEGSFFISLGIDSYSTHGWPRRPARRSTVCRCSAHQFAAVDVQGLAGDEAGVPKVGGGPGDVFHLAVPLDRDTRQFLFLLFG